jgi:thiamine-monophosphate kinase
LSRLFISFEGRTKRRAVWLAERLRAGGHHTLIEDDFGPRAPRREMTSAIRECDIVVALVTHKFLFSPACQRELDIAEAEVRPVVAVFLDVDPRAQESRDLSAYRRIHIQGEWRDATAQWEEIAALIERALPRAEEASATHPREDSRVGHADFPDLAVLYYDVEDLDAAHNILRNLPRWSRSGDEAYSAESAEAAVLLWSSATAEIHSHARQAFDAVSAETPRYVIRLDAQDGGPDVPDLDMPIRQAPDVASVPLSRVKQLVTQQSEEVRRLNRGIMLDVFVDRFVASPRVAILAEDSYALARARLPGGYPLRLQAALDCALTQRFCGNWRAAVETIRQELIAAPEPPNDGQAEWLHRLRLERLSLKYELGEERPERTREGLSELLHHFRGKQHLNSYVQAGRVLGNVLREGGDFSSSDAVLQRTIGIAEFLAEDATSPNGRLLLADCLRELAQLAIGRRDFQAARDAIWEARALLGTSEAADLPASQYMLALLLYVEATLDERSDAAPHSVSPTRQADSALGTLALFDNPIRLATIYDWLGRAWTRHIPSGDVDLAAALEYLRKSLRIRSRYGHRYNLGMSHLSLGGLYAKQDQLADAIASYDSAREIFNERGVRPVLARAHASLAEAYFRKNLADGKEDTHRNYLENLEAAERLYAEINLETEGLELRYSFEHGGRKALETAVDDLPLIAVGEYHLHRWIRTYTAASVPNDASQRYRIVVGVGDDAALLEIPPDSGEGLVITTDAAPGSLASLDRDPKYVGRFTVVQTLADVIAMGATPTALLLNLFLTRDVTVGYARTLVKAVVDEAARYGVSVVGGDIKERGEPSVGSVALGHIRVGKELRRSTARAGQSLGITLASAHDSQGYRPIGMRWAQELIEYYRMDRQDAFDDFPELHKIVDPQAKYDLLYLPDRVMRTCVETGLVRCAMDTSDGVMACLEIIGRESNVGFEVLEEAVLPLLDARAVSLARILGIPPVLFIFSAGHDWEIVFTCEEGDARQLSEAVSASLSGHGSVAFIGRVRPREARDERGVDVLTADGRRHQARYYTDEKFVPRRYQDRPSQWLGFARRFGPSD